MHRLSAPIVSIANRAVTRTALALGHIYGAMPTAGLTYIRCNGYVAVCAAYGYLLVRLSAYNARIPTETLPRAPAQQGQAQALAQAQAHPALASLRPCHPS